MFSTVFAGEVTKRFRKFGPTVRETRLLLAGSAQRRRGPFLLLGGSPQKASPDGGPDFGREGFRETRPSFGHGRGSSVKIKSLGWMQIKEKNFGGLVLLCIDGYDSEQRRILQHFSRSTRIASFCIARISKFVDFLQLFFA